MLGVCLFAWWCFCVGVLCYLFCACILFNFIVLLFVVFGFLVLVVV